MVKTKVLLDLKDKFNSYRDYLVDTGSIFLLLILAMLMATLLTDIIKEDYITFIEILSLVLLETYFALIMFFADKGKGNIMSHILLGKVGALFLTLLSAIPIGIICGVIYLFQKASQWIIPLLIVLGSITAFLLLNYIIAKIMMKIGGQK